MRLTQYTDYALRVLIHLALKPDQLSTIREISAAYEISQNHLMKVVQRLSQLGYVDSRRGRGGGLSLKREPGRIVVGQVVRDMEPDFGLVECFRPDNACVITGACVLPRALRQAVGAFLSELDNYTLADLVPEDRRGEMALRLRIDPS